MDFHCWHLLGFVIEDGPYGGYGGIPWTDGSGVNRNGYITAIEIRAQSEIDAIRARYGDTWGEWHGGSGGQYHAFELEPDELIQIVQGRSDKRTDQIEFITNLGHVFGPYGGSGGKAWVSARPGCALAYLSGSAENRLDSLTLHYECFEDEK